MPVSQTILSGIKTLFSRAAFWNKALRFPSSGTPFRQDNTVVNYVWVNNTPYRPRRIDPLCGVPLKSVDIALKNAARYPDAKFIFWVDYERLDDTSRVMLQSHAYVSGTPNFEIRNLRDIKPYTKFDAALGDNDDCFARPDIARLYILRECFKTLPHDNILYCDLDVEDARIGCPHTETLLQKHGLALSMAKAHPVRTSIERLQNMATEATTLGLGYIALQRGLGETFLNKHLMQGAYNDVVHRNWGSIYPAMKEALRQHGHGHPVHPEILLQPIRYKVPENFDYIAWGLNGYDYDDHTLD